MAVKKSFHNPEGKSTKKQQSVDTNGGLCAIRGQVKPKSDFGDQTVYAYDKVLQRNREIVISYKSCGNVENNRDTKNMVMINVAHPEH